MHRPREKGESRLFGITGTAGDTGEKSKRYVCLFRPQGQRVTEDARKPAIVMMNMGGPSTIEQQYTDIGGCSPILRYTELQAYVAFRYARPLRDGAAVAFTFTQYPHSLNKLFRRGQIGDVEWSVIDRWGTHPGFNESVAQHVKAAIAKFPEATRSDTVLLFSTHFLPMSVGNCGDPFILEVSAIVATVMERMTRSTSRTRKTPVVLVPIAFTSDHIETLYELELKCLKEQHGMEAIRGESLNDSPVFIRALAGIASEHLRAPTSVQLGLGLRCPGCTNATGLFLSSFPP
ncbi:hypothetical protein PLICRDRAFT_58548 [Plicaturopsis crispa FD-325 SS-3]|uniref:Ferrochelatase n=1 Tax=Plicaturopsis crispa FD-325 SS-3 TaxID=944288 RepID=A0A0C9SK59_PLICR|nr:hypothetical protein PLICRDRAFT_58548 [Plicaturopsis crispa FD-325 SS-3]